MAFAGQVEKADAVHPFVHDEDTTCLAERRLPMPRRVAKLFWVLPEFFASERRRQMRLVTPLAGEDVPFAA